MGLLLLRGGRPVGRAGRRHHDHRGYGNPPGRDRGATLSEYALVVSFVLVAILAVVGHIQDESGSYLMETGSDIGVPRELAADLDPDLPEPPVWLTQPPPPETTTTTAPTTTTTAPITTTTTSPAVPRRLVAIHASKCLELPGGGASDDLAILLATCNGSPEQLFALQLLDGGDIEIVTSAGKCLRPLGGSDVWGTPIVQSACDQTPVARWTSISRPDGIELRSKATGLCLTVDEEGTNDGTAINQWECVGGANQTFATSPAVPGRLTAIHASKCLELPGGGASDDLAILLATCNGSPEQLFILRLLDGGDIEIVTSAGKCLRPLGGSDVWGTRIVQNACDQTPVARWTSTAGPNGMELRSKPTGLCLDVNGAIADDGTEILQWECHGGTNQAFVFDGTIG